MTPGTQNTATFYINMVNRVGAPVFFFGMCMWYMPKFLDGLVQNGEKMTQAIQAVEKSNTAIGSTQERQLEILGRIDRGQDRLSEVITSIRTADKPNGT